MSIYQGDTKVSGNSKVSSLPLFTTQWQDHITNDASWLRSETFSWQSGSVYTSAYAHLVADVSGITAETETVAGTTITFKRAADGHKIVDDTQVSNVEAIYTATGVAWYYVLDTTNQRFKLPRSKYAFVGLRDNVGNYVAESLPNITGELSGVNMSVESQSWNGSLSSTYGGNAHRGDGISPASTVNFNASRSSSTYQDNAPVQQRATQAYLYFYVGNTVQDQTTIDVGEITEELNDKVDLDGSNATFPHIVETYSNGASWYRVYSDGWCEQGGVSSGAASVTYSASVVFVKQFANADYTLLTQAGRTNNDTSYINNQSYVYSKSATGFSAICYGDGSSSFIAWEAKGYLPSAS